MIRVIGAIALTGLALMQVTPKPMTPAIQVTPWTVGPGDAPVRFRGVSAASDTVVWASGTKGTVVRTPDSGGTWPVSY
jgi:photosystem II stability/assembly factor-like uncharacterized protein